MKKKIAKVPRTQTVQKRSKKQATKGWTIGIDLGDRSSRYTILDAQGDTLREGSFSTTKKGFNAHFAALSRTRMIIEVGTHSPWVSRLLSKMGHEVFVANPRRTRLIAESNSKDDCLDSNTLARLGRVDPKLLFPITHRNETEQGDLAMIRARAKLVHSRTALINSVRGMTKSFGERLGKCDADQVNEKMTDGLPAALQAAVNPMLQLVHSLTENIREYDAKIEAIAKERYPQIELLKQVAGVGTLTALTFMLIIADPQRFQRSRDVGCYVGMRPRRRQSGKSNPQLSITKEGDTYARSLLVQAAQTILSRRGPDTDLQRWGRKLAARGGKAAKKRAVIAVARKLAVLLHHLWVCGEVYEPLRLAQAQQQAASQAA
jgi:transposase